MLPLVYRHSRGWGLNPQLVSYSTRLENRKSLSSEPAEKYIADMSELALLVGIKEEELSKALIRGLPSKLRWDGFKQSTDDQRKTSVPGSTLLPLWKERPFRGPMFSS